MAEVLSSAFHHVGWMFLPNFGTSVLQSLYYSFTLRAGQRRPQAGEPLYELHRRRLHVIVLVLYLIYTLTQTLYDVRLSPDFYAMLGVSPCATEREIKSRFRRLAARFHPDKIAQGDVDLDATSDSIFVQLKLAHDTLIAPAKRFAYDRFGPSVVRYTPHPHEKLQTKRDYVYSGLRSLLPQYIQGGISLVLLNYFWFPKYGQFWRYFAVFTLALVEFTLLTHEWSPSRITTFVGSMLRNLLPDLIPAHLLPFQVLTIARRLSISINIFISQLAPPGGQQRIAAQSRQSDLMMSHLSQAAGRVDEEATGLVNLGFAPYKGDRELVDRLRTSMTEGISLGAIRQNPIVKEAIVRARARRNQNTTEIESQYARSD